MTEDTVSLHDGECDFGGREWCRLCRAELEHPMTEDTVSRPDPEPLTTYMGQPVEPHVVEWPEAERYFCGSCGHEVDCDGGEWTHKDDRYQAW